ncbi:sarcosine oxidase subunit delta [Rhodobacteraceae bacterium]|nr:sarcosine oxidase subunit delta [Paracoccaceae bacterium]
MLKFECPNCKFIADETELSPGGEAHITRESGSSSDKKFSSYLFERKNPRGVHFERWLHQFGCGKWFIAARCTFTMEVFGTYSAQTLKPPGALLRKIKSKRPEWEGFLK